VQVVKELCVITFTTITTTMTTTYCCWCCYLGHCWIIDLQFLGGGRGKRKAFCTLPHNLTSTESTATKFQDNTGWWMILTACWRCNLPDFRPSFTYFSSSPIATLRLNLWDGASFGSTEISFVAGSEPATYSVESPWLPTKYVNQWKYLLQQNTLATTGGL
jgi:hypothetical protein